MKFNYNQQFQSSVGPALNECTIWSLTLGVKTRMMYFSSNHYLNIMWAFKIAEQRTSFYKWVLTWEQEKSLFLNKLTDTGFNLQVTLVPVDQCIQLCTLIRTSALCSSPPHWPLDGRPLAERQTHNKALHWKVPGTFLSLELTSRSLPWVKSRQGTCDLHFHSRPKPLEDYANWPADLRMTVGHFMSRAGF